MIIADSFNLDLLFPTHCVLTRYLDMADELNLVIDLIFLWSGLTELNNYSIHPDWCLSSDHALLTMLIPIVEENIISSKFSIVKNSEEKMNFIIDVSYTIKSINITDLSNTNKLEEVTNNLISKTDYAWRTNSKQVNITRHSKSWWNEKCSLALNNYRITRSLENWKIFRSKVKFTK